MTTNQWFATVDKLTDRILVLLQILQIRKQFSEAIFSWNYKLILIRSSFGFSGIINDNYGAITKFDLSRTSTNYGILKRLNEITIAKCESSAFDRFKARIWRCTQTSIFFSVVDRYWEQEFVKMFGMYRLLILFRGRMSRRRWSRMASRAGASKTAARRVRIKYRRFGKLLLHPLKM